MRLAPEIKTMHAMILAAGRGERLRPLTDTVPKPMIKVHGKPLIQWHLEALGQAGISTVTINLAHLGEQIRSHVGSGEQYGVQVRYSCEPVGALETAGGIATARPWIDPQGHHNPNPFLVINADVFTDWPISQAFEISQSILRAKTASAEADARCHLILVDNPEHHPAGDFGLAPPSENHSERQVVRRPAAESLTFSGIGVYDPSLFDAIRPGERAALAPLLHRAIAEGRCTGSHFRGMWSDVGTPERLALLNQA